MQEQRNRLTGEDISDEDYEHAQNVWRTFKCKSLRDYLAIYLKADVTLLKDVFEEFRAVCLKAYALDPCWYYTAPSLAWDETFNVVFAVALLKAQSATGKQKNNYTEEKPESGAESNFIAFLDTNNLYGWAMCHALPTGNFKLIKLDAEGDDFVVKKLKAMTKDDSRGCILEVEVEDPVYGKTMENVRKRMDTELVTEINQLEKCVASIYFKDRTIYTEGLCGLCGLCAVHYHKKKVVLDKPTYVGMAILDISKTL
ncbi:hypothetical protein B566_EDAN015261, partial [Ephemera danica]